MDMKKKKFNFSGIFALVCALLLLVIFVPVNMIASYRDKVYDMTPAKQYTLNSKTKELLDATKDKDIEIYFMLESLQPLKDNPEYLALYHTLSELKKRDNITLTCKEPNEDPELTLSLNPMGNLGVERGDVFVKCGDIIKRVSHDKIFQSSTVYKQAREYAGEELIAGAIKICTSDSLPTIYFLTGHGEGSINDTYRQYAKRLKSDNYDAAELNLGETGAIPENAASLWIVGPKKDITETEADMLLAYIGQGGSVSVLAGPCETKGRFRNLEKVLSHYGIEMDYNIVSDTYSSNQLNDNTDTQNPNYFRVSFFQRSKDDGYTQDLTTDLFTLINDFALTAGTYNTRSFGILPETQFDAANIEVCSLMTNVTDDGGEYKTVSTPMGGDETTADFAEKELSGTLLDLALYSYDRISGGKLFVMGSSDLVDPTMTPKKGELAASYLVLFSNTWLYDSDIDMGIGNKANAYDTMIFKSAKEAKRVMALTTILPAAIIIFGVLVWLKRRYA